MFDFTRVNCARNSGRRSHTQRRFIPKLRPPLNAPITSKVFCFSRLLKFLRSLYGKQCGPRSESVLGPLCLLLYLTLNVPIATKVVCFSRLLKCLNSLFVKQCGPRTDCSFRSSLFWVHAGCFYTEFVSNVRHFLQHTTSADDIFRCIFFLAL